MADTSFCQINDIVLSIPPDAIKIEHQSFNNFWQTLRTQSSIKSKSGFAQINITMSVKFCDDVLFPVRGQAHLNGLKQLRDLISQFRATPFCYIDNEFIRNAVLAGNSDRSMALAIRNIEISKADNSTNIVNVVLHFSWFNYFPFIKNFTFKKDIFTPDETYDPQESRAWKLFYEAEQIRNDYREITNIQDVVELTYSEYKFLPYKKYQDLKDEANVLSTVKNEASRNLQYAKRFQKPELISVFAAGLEDEEVASKLVDRVFGNNTSLTTKSLISAIDTTLDNPNHQYFFVLDSNWKVVQLNKAKDQIIKFKSKLMDNKESSEDLKEEDLVLLEKQHILNLDAAGIITTGIHISFENILATIPMLGYSLPTFQHIGSIDGVVTLSLIANTDDAVRSLSNLYNSVEEQSFKNRQIPQGHRNIRINNALINMCGLHYFLTNNMTIDTVPGLPGTYAGTLELINDQLTPNTSEELTSANKFNTSKDIRAKIVEILGRNLITKSNLYNKENDVLVLNHSTSLKEIVNDLTFQYNYRDYYQYKGPKLDNQLYFRKLCETYAQFLSQLLEKLAPVLQEHTLGTVTFTGIYDLFSLTDEDMPGITRIQEDLYPIFQQNTLLRQFQGSSITEINQLRTLSKATINQRFTFLENQLNQIKESLTNADSNYADKAEKLVRDTAQYGNSTAIFIAKYLGDYQNQIFSWLDKITYSGMLNLPEFKEVNDLISQNAIASTNTCYPDFPLDNVIQLIGKSKDPELHQAYQTLIDIFNKSNLGLQEESIASLINPDFYFFNPQNDILDEIIPAEIINNASKAIIASRDAMAASEKKWFEQVYDEHILGQVKKPSMLGKIADTINNKLFQTTKAGRAYISEVKTSIKNNAVMPPGLTGQVKSAIKQAIELGNSIQLQAIEAGNTKTKDQQNTIMNYREASLLKSSPNADAAVHFFDTEQCLSVQSADSYYNSNTNEKKLRFFSPVPNGCVPTSDFGKRYDPVAKQQGEFVERFHYGLDLAPNPQLIPSSNQNDLPIKSVAHGKIIYVENPVNARSKGCHIYIDHGNGLMTYYQHLQNESTYQNLYNTWLSAQKGEISQDYANGQLEVFGGEIIGLMGNTGHSTGTHLHFGVYEYSGNEPNKSSKNIPQGTPVDPMTYLDPDEIPSKGPVQGIDANNDSLFTKSIQQFEKELRNGQGYSLMRAYPTFKLYFIESDLGERKRYAFDDFFAYSSVKSIQVIRNRKIAADLCVLELTNISGVLSNRKFHSVLNPEQAKTATGETVEERTDQQGAVNTKSENPIASLMLQPGIQIQLKLGYSNQINELETVFNGIITDVAFSDTDDLVQLTCQSFALEFVQNIHGTPRTYGSGWSRNGKTYKILEEILAFPEVVHFGRWEPGVTLGNTAYPLLSKRWKLLPAPQDDNIFAPQGNNSLGLIDTIVETLMGSSQYVMYNTTLWDVVQEMTLRHPAYIAQIVPYEDKWGPRCTLFFGVPDQVYYARDPSFKEDTIAYALQNVITNGNYKDAEELLASDVKNPHSNLSNGIIDTLKKSPYKEKYFELWKKQYALDKGYIKPFRNYHIASSAMHILYNSITSSGHNTFNVATVHFGTEAAEIDKATGELNFGDYEELKEALSFTLKADAAIPDEETRELFAQYPNCIGEEMAKNYALSLLQQSLKESYKGTLVIIGNPKIKSNDIVYIFDEYTDMYGPIEVEQVVHKFSQETGFISEITPDMCVHINQFSTISTSDAMGLIVEHGMKSIGMESILPAINTTNKMIGLATGTSLLSTLFFSSKENTLNRGQTHSLFGLVGTFIFKKLITRTQLAHPFRYSPLVLHNRPMIGGLPNRRTGGEFTELIDQWISDFDTSVTSYTEDLMTKFNPRNWLGKTQGEIDF